MLRLHLGETSLSSAAREPFLGRPTASFTSLLCTLQLLLLLDCASFLHMQSNFPNESVTLAALGRNSSSETLTARDQMRAAVEKQLLGTYSLSLVSSAPPRRAGSLSCSDFTVRTPGSMYRNHVLVQWQRWWGKWGPSSPVSLPFRSCAGATAPLKHCLKTATHPLQVFRALPRVTLKILALGGQGQQMA